MNWLHMASPILLLVALTTGALAGWLHFTTLSHLSMMLVRGKIAAVALQIARFFVLAGLLYLWARSGALPLLACSGGILAGRTFVLKRSQLP